MKFQDHDEFPKFDQRAPPSRQGAKHSAGAAPTGLSGVVPKDRPPRKNWEKFEADKWRGFTARLDRAKPADRVKLIYWDSTGGVPVQASARRWQVPLAERTGRVMWLSAAEFSACWKGSIGSVFTRRRRYQRGCSREDYGTLNQRAGNARDAALHGLTCHDRFGGFASRRSGTLKAMLIAGGCKTNGTSSRVRSSSCGTLPEDQMLLGLEDLE